MPEMGWITAHTGCQRHFSGGSRSPGLLQPANCDSEERSNNVTTRCHQQRFTPAGTGETDAPAPFDWHNATVYFVLTDRFENGDPSNDQSYGRHKDGMAEIGTFHGGDLRGLTNKLDYLQQLGVNALWISAPFEQIHGWVGGGTKGDFPHYAYHGYYTQDWTNLDANMGSEADLRTLVDSAHQRGIRIL